MIRSLAAKVDENTQELTLQRNLDPKTIQKDLESDTVSGYLYWIDIVDATDEEILWLSELFHFHPAVIEDLQREDRRPSMMVYPSYLFLSLIEPQIRMSQVMSKEIHCIIMDNYFITVRPANAGTVDTAYDRVAQNPESFRFGVAYFLYLTSQFVIDAYYPLMDNISDQLSIMEEKLLNGGIDKIARKRVYRVKQQLINLRQMVAPQREVLSNVIGEKRLAQNIDTRDLFRHLYERLLRVYDVIDSQRDLSSNVLDMMQNQESRTLGEAVHRLTIFSMIFLPLTFFTGLFELNFASTADPIVLPIPGSMMFIGVIGAMVLSAGMMTYVFRRQGWI